jgi:gamma-glutamyl:cysteine ligase YbdK (ATP-grasp superfamily)
MLHGTVTAPLWGIKDDRSIKVPGVDKYSREDLEAMAARSIMVSAQAAARAAAESAGKKYLKEHPLKDGATDEQRKAVQAGANKAASDALNAWLKDEAPGYMVERRDEEAMQAKKVEKVVSTAKGLGKDDAAKLLQALLAANPDLAKQMRPQAAK